MTEALTPDERRDLERLARDALRDAATAQGVPAALGWAEAACACLRVVAAPEHALRAAGALLDRLPAGAPFAGEWKRITAPLAARAEAMHLLDIESDVEKQAERLSRP